MDRRNKKFLLGSTLFHACLVLLVVFGSAFFVAKDKKLDLPRINVVPSRLVDDALAGGGGNPNLPRTEDRQKGQTLAPQPPLEAPVPPPTAQAKPTPAPPEPVKPPPEPKESPKPVVQKTSVPKVTEPKKPEPKPKETEKPEESIVSQLKPVKRNTVDKEKARKEAEQREAARQAAEQARQTRIAQERFASAIGKATSALQRGFSSGTKVEVGGPGGEAYANYAAFVQAAYENAWQLPTGYADDDSVAVVKVTISKTGTVIESRISSRSGSSVMDRSVQRALDRVKAEGLPPFPDGAKEPERTFTIEFNLKAKRLTG